MGTHNGQKSTEICKNVVQLQCFINTKTSSIEKLKFYLFRSCTQEFLIHRARVKEFAKQHKQISMAKVLLKLLWSFKKGDELLRDIIHISYVHIPTLTEFLLTRRFEFPMLLV